MRSSSTSTRPNKCQDNAAIALCRIHFYKQNSTLSHKLSTLTVTLWRARGPLNFYLPQHEAGQSFRTHHSGWRFLDPTITDIAAPTRTFSTPNIRTTRQTKSGKWARIVQDPKWWDASVDLSQYDGMTQQEVHRDMQREWADLRKRMLTN